MNGPTADPGGATGAWQADLARYPPRPFLREQSIFAVAVYRFGQWNDRRPTGPARLVLERLYWVAFRAVETILGVSLPKATVIGPGLRVHHFGGVFVNERSHIGARCTLRQGVTIGSREDDGPAPILGADVDLGAYAQVLGDVHIGDGARIGSMSVVLIDVPAGATAAGVPARIIAAHGEPSPCPTGIDLRGTGLSSDVSHVRDVSVLGGDVSGSGR
jgi:serine O-acetyltransferase